jgi:hypothetical protein
MRPAATPVRVDAPDAADQAFATGMAKLVRLMARQAAAEHHANRGPARQSTDDLGTPAV